MYQQHHTLKKTQVASTRTSIRLMIVMGDFNMQVGQISNPMETATDTFALQSRNEKGDTLEE